jgi:hypothetical protein
MITMPVAREVAHEAVAPIAYVMGGADDFHIGRCRLHGRAALCPARVYGLLEDVRLKVREIEQSDGSIGYVVFDIVDVTPKPEAFPAPVR